MLSLIQTSRDRRSELIRFIASLNSQKDIDFKELQFIFIDQGNNKCCFDELNSDIHFVYVQIIPCSLSHARNIALSYVQGEYVCFPDDDCWYEPDTLSKVLSKLEKGIDGVIAKGTNEKGELTNTFPNKHQLVSKKDRCGAISYTMFVRYQKQLFFDEYLGIGTQYGLGSGEETDYLLYLLEKYDYTIEYFPDIVVHHPCFVTQMNSQILQKAYLYARGFGYLMRKHKFSFLYIVKKIVKPFGGTVLFFILGKVGRSKYSYNILKGRIEGLFFSRKRVDRYV